VILKCHS